MEGGEEEVMKGLYEGKEKGGGGVEGRVVGGGESG